MLLANDSPCVMRLLMLSSLSWSGPVFSQVSMSEKPLVMDSTSFGPSEMLARTTTTRMVTTAAPMMSRARTIDRTLGRKR